MLSFEVVVWFRKQGNDTQFTMGLMSGGKSRCMRLLLPLGLVLQLLHKASIPDFMHRGLLITQLEHLSENERMSRVLWLKKRTHERPFCEFVDTQVVWSTFELSCDFRKSMHRIQLSAFGRGGRPHQEWYEAGKRFLDALCDLLLLEKKRQMQSPEFPRVPLPWSVKDVMTMPVVLWVRTLKRATARHQ